MKFGIMVTKTSYVIVPHRDLLTPLSTVPLTLPPFLMARRPHPAGTEFESVHVHVHTGVYQV